MSQIITCKNCSSLKELILKINKSLYNRIRGKWFNDIYNTDVHFNQSVYKDLVRYKRIAERRTYNMEYPSCLIDSQDIISKINLLINK